jgi:hypothetical protein
MQGCWCRTCFLRRRWVPAPTAGWRCWRSPKADGFCTSGSSRSRGNLVGLVLPRRWARWEPLRIPGGRYRCRRPARGVRGGFQPDAVPQVADRAERRLVRLVLPRPSLTDEGEEPPGARASGDSSKAVQPNELQGHARACHRNGRASLVACRSAGVSSATRRAMVSRSWIASTTRRAMASVVCR